MGTPLVEVVAFTVIAAIGVYAFIVGSIGYFKEHLNTALRGAFVCLGLLCLQPLHAALSGIAAAASLLLIGFMMVRHRQKSVAVQSGTPV
jgi:TRAP-type uncharacterized transport system fused permease subunit